MPATKIDASCFAVLDGRTGELFTLDKVPLLFNSYAACQHFIDDICPGKGYAVTQACIVPYIEEEDEDEEPPHDLSQKGRENDVIVKDYDCEEDAADDSNIHEDEDGNTYFRGVW